MDWWPWCEEAWAEARRLDKPVLVSIGYSSCHWCHVMARESFSNDFIASLMNRHFVCIKVDREERPDIDQLFMESVQMITGQGGWPLNAFCLPDGRPFFGGTYFPPEDRGVNLVPWPQLIMRIADHYRKAPDELEENARSIFGNLYFSNAPLGGAETLSFSNRDLITSAENLCSQYDVQNGGFGGAPKFPPAMSLNFLDALRGSAAVEARPELGSALDTVLAGTLTAMARGGIYDQIGGGFARYSVDAHWEIPHFEKMLYDNALLIGAFLRGYQRTREPLYLSIIEETIGWLDSQMRATHAPAYYAALDAETDGKEGVYYLWSPAEITEILGAEDGKRFCEAYGISEAGNFDKTGLSNPIWHGKEQSLRDALAPLRAKILAARQKRTAPGRDNKILTGWNALLASALAEAGFWLGRDDYLAKARTLVDWLWDTMATPQADGTVNLYAVYYEDGGPRIDAFLDDYAALAQACFTLAGKVAALEPGAHSLYIERGDALLRTTEQRFADANAPGWFFTPAEAAAAVAGEAAGTDATDVGTAPAASANAAMKTAVDKLESGKCDSADEATAAHPESCGYDHSQESESHEACCGGQHHDSENRGSCCGGSEHDTHPQAGDCCEGGSDSTESGCCGGNQDSDKKGGCGCSHDHDEPEDVPFVAPAPGNTLLRKKYWLDNATPAGASLLLHAFGSQQALSDSFAADAAATITRTRPAYAALSARAPGAIAHALTAFAEQAVGYAVVQTQGGSEAVAPLREALSARPWRNCFILAKVDATSQPQSAADASVPTYQLCVGTQCLPPESSAQAIAELI